MKLRSTSWIPMLLYFCIVRLVVEAVRRWNFFKERDSRMCATSKEGSAHGGVPAFLWSNDVNRAACSAKFLLGLIGGLACQVGPRIPVYFICHGVYTIPSKIQISYCR